MKKSGRISFRRGAHHHKAEGGESTMSLIQRIRECLVILLCVAIVGVPCVILSRSVKPTDLLGQSTVKWRISYSFRMGMGEDPFLRRGDLEDGNDVQSSTLGGFDFPMSTWVHICGKQGTLGDWGPGLLLGLRHLMDELMRIELVTADWQLATANPQA